MTLTHWIGIDYGSKTSGNTVICHHDGQVLQFYDADRRDADAFIIRFIEQPQSSSIQHVFIDAPLSLPGVYTRQQGCTNFHYRQCDMALKAMSPMFLGGLTARAMELRQTLTTKHALSVYEVYPKALAQLELKNQYHKKLAKIDFPNLCDLLTSKYPSVLFNEYPRHQHQFDSLLAWLSGYRFIHHQHQIIGEPSEGQVVI